MRGQILWCEVCRVARDSWGQLELLEPQGFDSLVAPCWSPRREVGGALCLVVQADGDKRLQVGGYWSLVQCPVTFLVLSVDLSWLQKAFFPSGVAALAQG